MMATEVVTNVLSKELGGIVPELHNTKIFHPITGRPLCLGRTRARHTGESRLKAMKLASALSVLPPDFAPTVIDNTSGITSWGMFLNDQLGDCTCAGPAHQIQVWTAKGGKEVTVPDSDVLTAYEKFDGYVPGDPFTDQGGDILTVCQDWQNIGIGGHKISGFAHVNMTQENWMQALYLFGSLNTGVTFPKFALDQVGGTWDFDPSKPVEPPDPTLGHCMALVGGDLEGCTFITWGELQRATWRFVMHYFDECVACQSPEWTPPVEIPDGLQLVGL
jgi:hypothetical protein